MYIKKYITYNTTIATKKEEIMASKEQLRKIAIYCDSYNPQKEDSLDMTSQVYDEKFESCENCSHFTKERKCDVDLIDKVLTSLAMELDLKS